jgi:hypothetical protein
LRLAAENLLNIMPQAVATWANGLQRVNGTSNVNLRARVRREPVLSTAADAARKL